MKNKVADVFEKVNNVSAENDSVEKYLTFFIDEQLLAVPSSQVVEIIRVQPITYMPKLPVYVKGIINLRGKIVPLIDLRLKFRKAEREYDEHTSIIVVETSDFTVGLIVDAVNDVTNIAASKIADSPTLSKDRTNNFVVGIAALENAVAMILDVVRILEDTSEDDISVPKSAEDTSEDA